MPWVGTGDKISAEYRQKFQEQVFRAFSEPEELVGHTFLEIEQEIHHEDPTARKVLSCVCCFYHTFKHLHQITKEWLEALGRASKEAFAYEAHA